MNNNAWKVIRKSYIGLVIITFFGLFTLGYKFLWDYSSVAMFILTGVDIILFVGGGFFIKWLFKDFTYDPKTKTFIRTTSPVKSERNIFIWHYTPAPRDGKLRLFACADEPGNTIYLRQMASTDANITSEFFAWADIPIPSLNNTKV